jgi:diguanylate cyclase (GGDEF)-like protein
MIESMARRPRIGIFMNWPESDSYQIDFLRGADRVARGRDADILAFGIGNMLPDPTLEHPGLALLDYVRGELLDGAVFLTASFILDAAASRTRALRDLNPRLPMVSVGQAVEGMMNVLIDNAAGFSRLLDHLFEEHGYRRPAFLAGPAASWDSNVRLECFKAALARHGIPWQSERVIHGDFRFESGAKAAAELFHVACEPPDVVVCANDNMAIGLRQALVARGFDPWRVAITGFDDTVYSEWFGNPLTTVRQPMETCGAAAMELVLDAIGGTPAPAEPCHLPTVPVYRGSCGCPAQTGGTTAMSVANRYLNDALDSILTRDHLRNAEVTFSNFARVYVSTGCIGGHDDESHLLERLGVGSLCITTFEDAGSPSGASRLHVAWTGGQRLDLPAGGLAFDGRELLPTAYLPRERSSLIVSVLEERRHGHGLVVCQYGVPIAALDSFCHHLTEAMVSVGISQRLRRMNDELREAKARVEQLSMTDELTGLLNRRGFVELGRRQAAWCRREGHGFWVLFLDLDGLKAINDTWGHASGDAAIRGLGEAIRATFRGTDVVARLGGDEFIVLATDSGAESLSAALVRLADHAGRNGGPASRPWRLEYSLGSVHSPTGDMRSVESLMDEADTILYAEKRRKKEGGVSSGPGGGPAGPA